MSSKNEFTSSKRRQQLNELVAGSRSEYGKNSRVTPPRSRIIQLSSRQLSAKPKRV
jgi:hypothetical protein